MNARIYKSKETAEKGRKRIIDTWPSYLKMDERLWIVKYTNGDGFYRLLDYAPRRVSAEESQTHYLEVA